MFDLVVKHGRVVKPQMHDSCPDTGINGHYPAYAGHFPETEIRQPGCASGCLALPGLAAFRLHAFCGCIDTGCSAELSCFPHGVTPAVDAGFSGKAACHLFSGTIRKSLVRLTVQGTVAPVNVSRFNASTAVWLGRTSARLS